MTGTATTKEPLMDAIQFAHTVIQNPVVRSAVQHGFEVRDQALRLQTALLAALNLPSAEDLASVAARLRSLSQRLEAIEDAVERVDRNVQRVSAAAERERRETPVSDTSQQ